MADRGDFDNLILPHLDAVYRAALALSRDHADARDLAQSVMLKAMQRFDAFKPGTSAKAWLMRIMRNTWIDQLRHRQVVGTVVPLEEELLLVEDTAAEPAGSMEDMLEAFSDAQVLTAMGELPESQRLALLLVDVEQMSHDEVAEVMGVAVGTIKSRTGRARAAMRHRLLEHARDLGFVKRT